MMQKTTTRIRVSSAGAGLAVALMTVSPAFSAGAFYRIGDLPGAAFLSTITDLSGDGRYVTGISATDSSHSESIGTVFRWSLAGGMENLEQESVGDQFGIIRGVSISRSGDLISGNGMLGSGFRLSIGGTVRNLGNALLVGDMTPSGSHIVGVSREEHERVVRYRASNNYVVEYLDVFPESIFQYATGVSDDGATMSIYVETEGIASTYLWRDGQTPTLLRSVSFSQFARGHSFEVSSNGNMVIGYDWMWTTSGGLRELASIIEPRSISPDGTIVLGSLQNRAKILNAAGQVQDVATLLGQRGIVFPGWHLTDIVAMSDDGTVWAGNGINPQGFQEGWVAVIPEPTSAALSVLGLIALIRRRR